MVYEDEGKQSNHCMRGGETVNGPAWSQGNDLIPGKPLDPKSVIKTRTHCTDRPQKRDQRTTQFCGYAVNSVNIQVVPLLDPTQWITSKITKPGNEMQSVGQNEI
ncbi:hypothetical protein RRG08_049111 [Elysia crispata]|uniref:Uncharacterized protein n=1 Tax=Elysia crispata TaxID=231223 RepID=A0AAE1D634_9GAST|nr:hypothetical protein RRG08_049111 [Elysia crispata]